MTTGSPDDERAPAPAPATPRRPSGPAWAHHFYAEHHDVLGHLVFRPVLSVHTPLAVLERDGEEFDGSPEQAPHYAREEHGVWVPRLAVWRRLGMKPPEREPEPVPSMEGGPVLHDDYVAFLKDFRRIIEGPEVLADQLAKLAELPHRGPQYLSYWESLRAADPRFPQIVFLHDVVKIDGIGLKLAQRLVARGLHVAQRVLNASDAELLAVPGLRRRTLAAIRKHAATRPL